MDWKLFLETVGKNLDAAQQDRASVTILELAKNVDAITAAAKDLPNPLGDGAEGIALIFALAAIATIRG